MEQAKPPPPHISPKGMWATKLALRVIQFALAIAIIGCVGSILSTGIWSVFTLIVITPQAAVSAIWSLAEGICILARGGRRGIHPGANVALDLLLWLGLVAGTILLWLFGIATALTVSSSSYWLDDFNRDYSSYDGYESVAEEIMRVAAMGQALIGLAATLTILHFVTFVIACVECSKRNRANTVVYVDASHYAQGPTYGYNGQGMGYSQAAPAPVYQHGGMKA
jgi:hypothetical protein